MHLQQVQSLTPECQGLGSGCLDLPQLNLAPHQCQQLLELQMRSLMTCFSSSSSQASLWSFPSSKEPVGSSTSSWMNLDTDSSRPNGSGGVQISQEASLQEKLKTLEQTVASLQAQLQVLQSSIPKVTAFITIVDIVKDTLLTEILVSTESPQKRGRGDGAGLFEPQAEQVLQLPWHF